MRIASKDSSDITESSFIVAMSIIERLSNRFSTKKIDKSKFYSRCKMEPLPNEIYKDIVYFQSDVNRPIDMSIYRELRKEAV